MAYQILGLREYFDEKTRKTNRTDKFFEMRWRFDDVTEIFFNPEAVLDRCKVPPEERYNLFYTWNDCDTKKRGFKKSELLPFDIDGIDRAKIGEYLQPVASAIGVDLSRMVVVASGNGLHFILRLAKAEEDLAYFAERKFQYNAIALRINETLEKLRLPGKADAVVFEPRRILRVPGTVNKKPGKEDSPAYVLHKGSLEPVDVDWEKLSGVKQMLPGDSVPVKDLKRFRANTGKDALETCLFLKHAKENAGAITEPEWYAAASIVGRFENGKDIFHDLSKGHPGYSSDATDAKLTQALTASGPRTCAGIQSLWGKCQACVHFGKIVSPIAISSKDNIPSEATGFYDLIETERGTKTIPNFDDLLKAFSRDNPYFIDVAGERLFIFDKSHWRVEPPLALQGYAEEKFDPKPKQRYRTEFAAKVMATNQWGRRQVEHFLYDTTHGKINLKNGILDPVTGKLEAHSSEYGFAYVLPYEYDPGAACPTFLKFLDDVTLGREELKETLLDFAAYVLIPRYDDHCFLWLPGDGRNGKSSYMEVLRALVGEENCSNILLDQFEDDFSLAQMNHKLINFSEESEGKKIPSSAIGRLKLLSAGGVLTVSNKNEKNFNMRSTAKLVFASNQTPNLENVGQAMASRMVVVPFDLELENFRDSKAKSKVDATIDDRMRAELPGILNLVVKRIAERAGKRFKVKRNQAGKEAAAEFFRYSDTIERWVFENVDLTGDLTSAPVRVEDLHRDFLDFMGFDARNSPKQGFLMRLKRKFKSKIVVSERKRFGTERDYEIRGLKLRDVASGEAALAGASKEKDY